MELPGQFFEQMAARYNVNDLKTIAFDLNIDWDELKGDAKSEKILSLVELVARDGRWAEFQPVLMRHNSFVEWPSAEALSDFNWAAYFSPAEPDDPSSFLQRLWKMILDLFR